MHFILLFWHLKSTPHLPRSRETLDCEQIQNTLVCSSIGQEHQQFSLVFSNLLTLHPHSPHRCTYSYPTHPGRQLNRAPALPFSPISVPPPHPMPSSMQCTSKIGRRKVPYITYITKLTLPAPPNQSISLSSQNSNLALLYLDMRSGPW